MVNVGKYSIHVVSGVYILNLNDQGILGGFPYQNNHFNVTSTEVAVICPSLIAKNPKMCHRSPEVQKSKYLRSGCDWNLKNPILRDWLVRNLM